MSIGRNAIIPCLAIFSPLQPAYRGEAVCLPDEIQAAAITSSLPEECANLAFACRGWQEEWARGIAASVPRVAELKISSAMLDLVWDDG